MLKHYSTWILLGFGLEFIIALYFLWRDPENTSIKWKVFTTIVVITLSFVLLRGVYEHW